MMLAILAVSMGCAALMWRWAPDGPRGEYALLGFLLGPLAFPLLILRRHGPARPDSTNGRP
jgi:hypothetical protein